jgi:hypothetical protein
METLIGIGAVIVRIASASADALIAEQTRGTFKLTAR